MGRCRSMQVDAFVGARPMLAVFTSIDTIGMTRTPLIFTTRGYRLSTTTKDKKRWVSYLSIVKKETVLYY